GCPIKAHDRLGGQARGKIGDGGDTCERGHNAGPGPQQPAAEGREQCEPAEQHHLMYVVAGDLVEAKMGREISGHDPVSPGPAKPAWQAEHKAGPTKRNCAEGWRPEGMPNFDTYWLGRFVSYSGWAATCGTAKGKAWALRLSRSRHSLEGQLF